MLAQVVVDLANLANRVPHRVIDPGRGRSRPRTILRPRRTQRNRNLPQTSTWAEQRSPSPVPFNAHSVALGGTERGDGAWSGNTQAQSGGRRRRCCSSARRWTRSASRRCCRFIVGSGVGAGLAAINCWFGRPGRDTSARRRSSSRVRHLSSSSSLIAPSSLCCRSSARAVRRTTSSNASDVRCVLFRSRRLAASCSRRAASDGHLRGRPRRGLAACSPCSATTAELSRISAHESCQGVTEDQRRLAPHLKDRRTRWQRLAHGTRAPTPARDHAQLQQDRCDPTRDSRAL